MKRKDLEEHIEEYLLEEQEDEKAKNTLIHYRHIINMFVSSLPDDEITKVDFMRFKEIMLEKYCLLYTSFLFSTSFSNILDIL